MATIKGWFTMNGMHIPIMEGQSKAEAAQKYINSKHGKTVAKLSSKNAKKENKSDTSYQGTNLGSGKASGKGITADKMADKLTVKDLSQNVYDSLKTEAKETYNQLQKCKGKPNAIITMYRATPGDKINNGDWIFLSRSQAERWTKTTFGRPKPGFKVIATKTAAKNIDWSGKNLEFVYIGEVNDKNINRKSSK